MTKTEVWIWLYTALDHQLSMIKATEGLIKIIVWHQVCV